MLQVVSAFSRTYRSLCRSFTEIVREFPPGGRRKCADILHDAPDNVNVNRSAIYLDGTGWLLRVAVQALARRLLPARADGRALVRTLRQPVRYGRDQQHVLPSSRGKDLCLVGPAGASRFSLRGKSEPLSDPHEEAEGSDGAAAALL